MTTKEKIALARALANVPVDERGEVLDIAKELAGGALVPKRQYKKEKKEKKAAKKAAPKKKPAAPAAPASPAAE